jgi:hypothetical protein
MKEIEATLLLNGTNRISLWNHGTDGFDCMVPYQNLQAGYKGAKKLWNQWLFAAITVTIWLDFGCLFFSLVPQN